jgi:hypothetical protein
MIKIWIQFLSKNRNLRETVFTTFLFGLISFLFSWFLIYVENRDHYLGEFIDPFFFWDPIDFSIPIFILTYGIIFSYITFHVKSPLKIVHFIQMIIFIVICRIISLTFIPFDAPLLVESTAMAATKDGQTLIPLLDPILNNMIYHQDSSGTYTHHDLFFSGHTAKCLLAALLFENKKMKIFFITLTCIMATFLVLQHVHYSIDILFAPLVSFLAIYLHKKWVKLKSRKI